MSYIVNYLLKTLEVNNVSSKAEPEIQRIVCLINYSGQPIRRQCQERIYIDLYNHLSRWSDQGVYIFHVDFIFVRCISLCLLYQFEYIMS